MARVLRLVPVGLGHGLLELDGRAQSVHGAWELDQSAVTGQLDQPSAMASQSGLQPLCPMGFQPGKGAVLVTAHQARIASDIRCQNCRQSPYHSLAGQEASPKGYSPKRYGPIARAGLHLRYWARRCRLYFRPLNRRSLCGLDRSVGPDRCLLPLFAPSRHSLGAGRSLLPRVKRTWRGLAVTSESDPQRTSRTGPGVTNCSSNSPSSSLIPNNLHSQNSSNPRPNSHRTAAAAQHLLALVRQRAKQDRSWRSRCSPCSPGSPPVPIRSTRSWPT